MAPKNEENTREMVEKLKESPAYRIAHYDPDFLQKDYLRPIRLQLEMMKAEITLRKQKILSTVVCFGGTKILQKDKAEKAAADLEFKLKKDPENKSLAKQLKIAVAVLEKSHFYDEAREFGRLATLEGKGSNDDGDEYVIVTGGGPGVMEAANRGAYEAGGKSIGLNITLPEEQEPNPYIAPELCLQFHYFALRKMHFMLRAKALVAFPGGYGTLDELFEALTLVQTGKVAPLPIILFGEKFWRELIDFDYLVDQGTIAEEDIDLFYYADSAATAWNYIKYFYEEEDKT